VAALELHLTTICRLGAGFSSISFGQRALCQTPPLRAFVQNKWDCCAFYFFALFCKKKGPEEVKRLNLLASSPFAHLPIWLPLQLLLLLASWLPTLLRTNAGAEAQAPKPHPKTLVIAAISSSESSCSRESRIFRRMRRILDCLQFCDHRA